LRRKERKELTLSILDPRRLIQTVRTCALYVGACNSIHLSKERKYKVVSAVVLHKREKTQRTHPRQKRSCPELDSQLFLSRVDSFSSH
jgi:hypothetical protein